MNDIGDGPSTAPDYDARLVRAVPNAMRERKRVLVLATQHSDHYRQLKRLLALPTASGLQRDWLAGFDNQMAAGLRITGV